VSRGSRTVCRQSAPHRALLNSAALRCRHTAHRRLALRAVTQDPVDLRVAPALKGRCAMPSPEGSCSEAPISVLRHRGGYDTSASVAVSEHPTRRRDCHCRPLDDVGRIVEGFRRLDAVRHLQQCLAVSAGHLDRTTAGRGVGNLCGRCGAEPWPAAGGGCALDTDGERMSLWRHRRSGRRLPNGADGSRTPRPVDGGWWAACLSKSPPMRVITLRP
jgi:hypothetical protein